MAFADYSPTVIAAYRLNENWWNYIEDRGLDGTHYTGYDLDGYDPYGYDIGGVDRAGYTQNQYVLNRGDLESGVHQIDSYNYVLKMWTFDGTWPVLTKEQTTEMKQEMTMQTGTQITVYADQDYSYRASYDEDIQLSYIEGVFEKKTIHFGSLEEMEAVANAMLKLVKIVKE